MRRSFPTPGQVRAPEIGCDELIARLEWELRSRPKRLETVRQAYTVFCARLLETLEKVRRRNSEGSRR